MHQSAVIIPVYNEAHGLPSLIQSLKEALKQLKQVSWEIIFVDDGSADESTQIIRDAQAFNEADFKITLVELSRNFGQQAALMAGLQYTTEKDFLCIIDADMQDPPELLGAFIEHYEKGYDVVYGVRQNRKEGALKKGAYWLFYRLFAMSAERMIPLDAGDFCLISRPVIQVLAKIDEKDLFLRGLRGWVGFKQIGIPYDRPARAFGEEKYTLRKLIRLAMSAFYGFSWLPIRFATICGLTSVGLAILYFCWVIARKLLGHEMPAGWASIISVVVFFGGVQLLTLGVIGEYIGRIYKQVLPRPSYIIKKKPTSEHGSN